MRGLIASSCVVVAGVIGSSNSFEQGLQHPVCMDNPGGTRSCLYDSFAQCQQATTSRSVGTNCIANPERFGTTGPSTTGQGGVIPPPVAAPPR
jgi:hypothetical protein